MTQKIKNKTKRNAKDGRSKYNMMKGLKNFKFKFKKQSSLIVAEVELLNGDVEHFVVSVKDKSFTLFKNKYIVNEKYLKYNRTFKMWVSKYHEELSLPINQSIPVKDLKNSVKSAKDEEVQDVVNNLNPAILVEFVKTQIIQKVFAGEAIGNLFGFLKIMAILTLIGVCICGVILIGLVT